METLWQVVHSDFCALGPFHGVGDYSPELVEPRRCSTVERVWLYLRERFLSHRVLANYEAVLDAACDAWNALVAEAGRLASLTAYPYLLRSELR